MEQNNVFKVAKILNFQLFQLKTKILVLQVVKVVFGFLLSIQMKINKHNVLLKNNVA